MSRTAALSAFEQWYRNGRRRVKGRDTVFVGSTAQLRAALKDYRARLEASSGEGSQMDRLREKVKGLVAELRSRGETTHDIMPSDKLAAASTSILRTGVKLARAFLKKGDRAGLQGHGGYKEAERQLAQMLAELKRRGESEDGAHAPYNSTKDGPLSDFLKRLLGVDEQEVTIPPMVGKQEGFGTGDVTSPEDAKRTIPQVEQRLQKLIALERRQDSTQATLTRTQIEQATGQLARLRAIAAGGTGRHYKDAALDRAHWTKDSMRANSWTGMRGDWFLSAKLSKDGAHYISFARHKDTRKRKIAGRFASLDAAKDAAAKLATSRDAYQVTITKQWKNSKTGATASAASSARFPWANEADRPNWKLVEAGFSVFNPRNGTYATKQVFKTRAEAEAWLRLLKDKAVDKLVITGDEGEQIRFAGKEYLVWRAASGWVVRRLADNVQERIDRATTAMEALKGFLSKHGTGDKVMDKNDPVSVKKEIAALKARKAALKGSDPEELHRLDDEIEALEQSLND